MKGLKVYQNHVAFWGSPFSNFHPCTFVYKDVEWKSSEQCFMAMKAKYFKDDESYERILNSTTPKEAKALGRKVKNFNFLWNFVSESIMFDIVLAKFSQNDDLKRLILSDEYKGKKFVEGSPSDTKWGVGMRYTNPAIDDESNWEGSNLLGKVLDKVREQLEN
ncbi:MAG: NADAR family protein [Bacteroidales bacterium]|nr:NADAR family protein [Bacteroidales bacterium]